MGATWFGLTQPGLGLVGFRLPSELKFPIQLYQVAHSLMKPKKTPLLYVITQLDTAQLALRKQHLSLGLCFRLGLD